MELKNAEIRELNSMSESYAEDNARAERIKLGDYKVIDLRIHTNIVDLILSLDDYPELKNTALKIADWVTKTHNSRQMTIIHKMEELLQCQKN